MSTSTPPPPPFITTTGQTSASQYGYVDESGAASDLQNSLYGNSSSGVSGGALGTYNANKDTILNDLSGSTSALGQTLNQVANYEANKAVNNTGSSFANQGALGSGAAAAAFGQAEAQPFAQAQESLQSLQSQEGSSALTSLMNNSTSAYNSSLSAASNLMENSSGLVAPTTMTDPVYTQEAGKNTANNSALISGGSNAIGTALGNKLGSYLGKAGGASATSDRRLKKNISTLKNALNNLCRLRGVTFDWIDPTVDSHHQHGVIAQEIEEVYPNLVYKNEAGIRSVNYNGLSATFIEAIKALKSDNDALRGRIEALEAKLAKE